MRIRDLTTWFASLACFLVALSCVQPQPEPPLTNGADATPHSAETEPTGEAAQPAYEDTFHFVVDVKDDGEGLAGGWQKAAATLKFGDWRHPFDPYFWQCPIVVGMPVRAELQGRIAARYAAQITAEITTNASRTVMHSRPSWKGMSALYCDDLYKLMRQTFHGPPYRIGATVSRQ